MCESSGPRLPSGVDVDGAPTSAGCRSTITFTSAGQGERRRSAPVARRQREDLRRPDAHGSQALNNDPQAGKRLTVEVTPAAPPNACSDDSRVPRSPEAPGGGGGLPLGHPLPGAHSRRRPTTRRPGNNGVSSWSTRSTIPVRPRRSSGPGPAPAPTGTTGRRRTSRPGSATTCQRVATVQAYAVDGCGNGTFSASRRSHGANDLDILSFPTRRPPTRCTWSASWPCPAAAGRWWSTARRCSRAPAEPDLDARQPGENRVEATLVEARAGGTWRFDLGACAVARRSACAW